MRHTIHKAITAAIIVVVVLPILPAAADPPPWAPAHGRRAKDAAKEDYDRDRYPDRDEHTVIHERRVVRYNEVVYRGDDGRYYCRRSDGSTGLIVGAVAGGLIGNQLARGKSATLGTLLGAGVGAVIGQSVDRGSVYCG